MNPQANFDLALRFHTQGAQIGEVFSFLSGLYFRGKLAYATRFARPFSTAGGVFIVTSDRGLVSAGTIVNPDDLRSFREVQIDCDEKRYVEPLMISAMKLGGEIPAGSEVVLLGSVGTKKYAAPLLQIFGLRLKFPADFVGRGDMSRGGLLLRSIDDARELEYISLEGAVVHGRRPPKLQKRQPVI